MEESEASWKRYERKNEVENSKTRLKHEANLFLVGRVGVGWYGVWRSRYWGTGVGFLDQT